jgi:hypothetical protein
MIHERKKEALKKKLKRLQFYSRFDQRSAVWAQTYEKSKIRFLEVNFDEKTELLKFVGNSCVIWCFRDASSSQPRPLKWSSSRGAQNGLKGEGGFQDQKGSSGDHFA